VTEDKAMNASDLVSVARESIVLLTVIIVAVIAGIAWTRFVVPFARAQADISAKTAQALQSIQATADAVARTAEAQRVHSEHLARMVERLEEADRLRRA
jgi:hypothetical protein